MNCVPLDIMEILTEADVDLALVQLENKTSLKLASLILKLDTFANVEKDILATNAKSKIFLFIRDQ